MPTLTPRLQRKTSAIRTNIAQAQGVLQDTRIMIESKTLTANEARQNIEALVKAQELIGQVMVESARVYGELLASESAC